jgi:hypothetical protein
VGLVVLPKDLQGGLQGSFQGSCICCSRGSKGDLLVVLELLESVEVLGLQGSTGHGLTVHKSMIFP